MVVAMVLTAAAGCGGAATDTPEPYIVSHTISAGDTVRLQLGEAAALAGSAVVIRFSSVEGDSRCPVDVVCVWEGDAHIRLEVRHAGTVRIRADLHTTLQPRSVRYDDLEFHLVDVAPAPTSTRTTPSHEYSIRIVVERT